MIYSTDTSVIGMHSEVIDFLARYGLAGVFLLIMVMINFRKHVDREIEKNSSLIKISMRYIICITIFYSILNPVISIGAGLILFFIFPIFLRFLNLEIEGCYR
ncbi:hypothetical protein SDC9_206344 [bioreactor metagenome]|uniref:Uncharacterized protein n=1 Tax=bioreactor metagenome TaxID=1076179 RepID=A0A645J5G6_9ZZZZ